MKRTFRLALSAIMVLGVAAACTSAQKSAVSTHAFLTDFGDRSVYSSGLIAAEQGALTALAAATEYHIDLTIADDLTTLNGTEAIHYTNQENQALTEIALQLYPNQLGGSVELSNVQVNEQPATLSYRENHSAALVALPSALQPGESVILTVDFQVKLPTSGGGNYGLFGYIDSILVLDGFYPGIPVYDESGWHAGHLPANADTTFNDASFYLVRVTAPANLVLVSSGVEVERQTRKNQQMVTFALGPGRDFYLAASSKFIKVSKTIGETMVNSYAFSDYQKGAELALTTAANALQDYSLRYGDYPYTEFDVVSTPMQGATGIEYPGIVGINKWVYDPSQSTGGVSAFVTLETTVAHEVGHQWFYNSVGNDQANEPWVDESLTQYVTGIYYLDEYGPEAMAEYRESWTGRWNRVNEEPIPIGLPADNYQGAQYSAIVYGRGPIFLQTLAEQMGQATFDQFLLDYARKYDWQISSTESFKSLAEAHCQCDLTPLFDEWVYKK